MPRAAILTPLLALAFLPGCDLINPSDWREGEEPVSECVDRLAGWDRNLDVASGAREIYVPTYTYDITKLGLEAIQDLSVEGADETAGARGMASTNETSTAIDAFMTQRVDSNGAFFMGNDPALYRVRGPAVPFEQIVPEGCERQQPNMRLIDIQAAAMQTGDPVGPGDATQTENEAIN